MARIPSRPKATSGAGLRAPASRTVQTGTGPCSKRSRVVLALLPVASVIATRVRASLRLPLPSDAVQDATRASVMATLLPP